MSSISSLSPDNEAFIEQQVAQGTYRDRIDAIEAGVELLRQRKALVDRLVESRRQLDEGDFLEFDEDGLEELFVHLIARAESRPSQQS